MRTDAAAPERAATNPLCTSTAGSPNGAGKSSLLKILIGSDVEIDGDVWRAEGLKIGYLQQEPQLDPNKNVWENILEGVGEQVALLSRFDQISIDMGEDRRATRSPARGCVHAPARRPPRPSQPLRDPSRHCAGDRRTRTSTHWWRSRGKSRSASTR